MAPEYKDIVVAGLHLNGQPLNPQMLAMGGKFKKLCFTAPIYKMYLIEDERGQKPGLVRLPYKASGYQYEVEIWELPLYEMGKFLFTIPPPLGLGTIVLEDGSLEKGFICEPCVVQEGKDISLYKGWRDYLFSINK